MADGTAAAASATHAAAFLLDSGTSIFRSVSTPADAVHGLSIFVLTITGGIFLAIAVLLTYAVIRFRGRPGDNTEPPQVFGSIQIELAWTIIPILLLVVLFLGSARVIFAVQDAPKPPDAVDVVVVGHQFWWEFRYPSLGITTANELHVPLSDPKHPTPTYLKLTSADVIHSFWVPRLAGKTDLLPDRVNEMWIDPHQTGLFLGQCAQFCGAEHAKMLLRVYVDTPQQFAQWVAHQQQPQLSGTTSPPANPVAASLAEPAISTPGAAPRPEASDSQNAAGKPIPPLHLLQASEPLTPPVNTAINPQQGRRVFEEQACMNCHTISGTVANGRYGPDLTHFASRDTLASGAAPNNPETLLNWITDPDTLKAGALMPAMHLTPTQNKQLVAYLESLH